MTDTPRQRDKFLGWVFTAKGEIFLNHDLTWYSPVAGLAQQAEKDVSRAQLAPSDGQPAVAMLGLLAEVSRGRAVYNIRPPRQTQDESGKDFSNITY